MPLQKFEWPLNAKALSNHIFKATNLEYVFAISIVFIDRKVLCLFFLLRSTSTNDHTKFSIELTKCDAVSGGSSTQMK